MDTTVSADSESAVAAAMPQVGLGTWRLAGDEAYQVVGQALAAGYRHIDTAWDYGNHDPIGRALAASAVPRDEVFLTSKVPVSKAGQEALTLRATLRTLRTDYLDLWLLHSPPDDPKVGLRMWEAARKAQRDGAVRFIGVSNHDHAAIAALADASGQQPAVNQIAWSPLRHNRVVLAAHRRSGVLLQGYRPLKEVDLSAPELQEPARAHGVTPAQVVLRWHLHHGIPVIPKTATPARLPENLDLAELSLTDAEIRRIDRMAARSGPRP